MTQEMKDRLVHFVLSKTPILFFNRCTEVYNTNALYGRVKNELMSAFPDIMPDTLRFAVVMADAFRPYECDAATCQSLFQQIRSLKIRITRSRKYDRGHCVSDLIAEHNQLSDQYNALIDPQTKLMAQYKKAIKK